MPQQKAQATFQRRVLVLAAIQHLSATGRWITQAEIVKHLNGQGYAVEKHNILRDLQALSESYVQLECNDNSSSGHLRRGLAYGYRWVGTDAPPDGGLSIPQALSLAMVERYLAGALPVTLTGALDNWFDCARHTLDLQHSNAATRWRDKICIVPPAQPLIAPPVDADVLAAVHRAVLDEKQLRLRHRAVDSEPKDVTVHPLGLIQRGPATYLVATAFEYDDILLYALHRIEVADETDEPARRPSDFTIDRYGEAQGHFGTGRPLKLTLKVCDLLAALLTETRLAHNQTLSGTDDTGWQTLTATVRDTWQLRWWLLSQGPDLQVIAPKRLRTEIAGLVCETSELYG